MGSKGKNYISYMFAIILAIVAIVAICLISVVFKIMPLDALPANYIGAALGSLLGALITLVLLRGQTDIEEKKGKDIKILEKKAEVFQDYIKDVWRVWEDQKITIEEFQNLTSKYYQNLMIYLKKERLEKIGNNLSAMGRNIGKDNYIAIADLRDNIIGVINELSDELELGGQVNTEIMDEHDRIVFPLIFKNQILEEANKVLPTDTTFEKGKFEFIQEFKGYSSLEYLCFDFIKYRGCRIVLNGFDGSKTINFILFVDTKYHKFDEFRCSPAGGRGYYVHRIKIGDYNLLDPIKDEKDAGISPPINFIDKDSMEKYRTEKRGFASIFANRIRYYFDEIKIGDDNILEFLEKHYEGQA